MSYLGSIKQEKVDDLEGVENDTEENNLNIKWIEVEKTEDVKYVITADVSSSEVGCGAQNSGQTPARLNVFHNQTGCDEHRKYSASKVIEYVRVSNIKEEKNDLEDLVMDIDNKYRPEKIADSKDSELAEDTCKDGNLSESVCPYQCKFCEYKAKTKNTLLRHFKVKHDDNPECYQCQFCEYRTKIKSALRSHFMSKHSTSDELYQCESQHCEYRTKLKSRLRRHIRQQHNALAEWYQCKFCVFRTKNKRYLRDHFTVKHDIAAEWLQCHLCEFKTKIKINIAKHFKKKHNLDAEWLQCQHCTFKTKNKDMLACHFISKHPSTEDWYQCQLCEYGTKCKSDFKKHFEYKHDQGAEQHHCVIFVSLNER